MNPQTPTTAPKLPFLRLTYIDAFDLPQRRAPTREDMKRAQERSEQRQTQARQTPKGDQ